ncbi:hypothetical protein [Nocardia sp. NPDC057353]|uniref:hypothetical protein n=1 Tax=Nocardia sp. NPDC057353 TaxID=3346104 RepID=UPI00362A6B3F
MSAWLAQQPAELATVGWKDLGPFAAGLGTLLAAFVAGWFLSRNSRKSPYDRLEQLSKARAEWPEGIEGRESLDRSIDYALARIRSLEGPAIHVHLTDEARRANREVSLAHLFAAFKGVLLIVVVSLLMPLARWATTLSWWRDTPESESSFILVVTMVCVGGALWGAYQTLWHGAQWWRWRRQWRPSDPR